MSKLTRAYFARPAAEVAPDLLGTVFVKREGDGLLRGRIVETEAYTGETDPGSHAFRGPTPRNRVMFGPAGHLYVYVSYGMHHCVNIVTDDVGVAGAVLIRALEPLTGLEIMMARRGGRSGVELCNGPGKLCAALGITRRENGLDLDDDVIWVEDDGFRPKEIARSTRVGLSAGREMPLRFFLTGNPFVSRGRVSAPDVPA